MFVHTSGFVHKSIRPETIIVFQEKGSLLGPSFLIGFERFRPGGAGTLLAGDASWEKNLYRHPKRQGLQPEDRYVMQHDIYSLGVCLLEIGLWNSFVCLDGDSLQPGPELESITEALLTKKSAVLIKQTLVLMASNRLPGLMGQRYADLALACLTCLDPGDTNLFGKETDLEDDDGIVVGVQYIEKVCSIPQFWTLLMRYRYSYR
jgi:serine/threonine protein kinase